MHRLGLRRTLVDPIVTTTYKQIIKAKIHETPKLATYAKLGGIKITPWADVAAAPRLDWGDPTWAVDYKNIECEW